MRKIYLFDDIPQEFVDAFMWYYYKHKDILARMWIMFEKRYSTYPPIIFECGKLVYLGYIREASKSPLTIYINERTITHEIH